MLTMEMCCCHPSGNHWSEIAFLMRHLAASMIKRLRQRIQARRASVAEKLYEFAQKKTACAGDGRTSRQHLHDIPERLAQRLGTERRGLLVDELLLQAASGARVHAKLDLAVGLRRGAGGHHATAHSLSGSSAVYLQAKQAGARLACRTRRMQGGPRKSST